MPPQQILHGSNPRATNAVIGNIMAKILSVTDRPLKQSQTAKQTSILQRIPLENACQNARFTLLFAIISAFTPMVESAEVHCLLSQIKNTMANEPTRLPMKTMTQLRRSCPSSLTDSRRNITERHSILIYSFLTTKKGLVQGHVEALGPHRLHKPQQPSVTFRGYRGRRHT